MQDSLRQFKADVFGALAHPTRISLIELLRDEGEVPVTRIHERLAVEQANASQHLAVLRGQRIVESRKEGNQVFYRLRDRRFGKVLDLMRDVFRDQLSEAKVMLDDMNMEKARK
jgi:ArsR family transcriptional regulator